MAPHQSESPAAVPGAVSWRMQRRVAAAAGGMAAVVAVTGVGVAAERSLPGEAFYGVKLAAEDARLLVARDDASRGRLHLEAAASRLDEAVALSRGTRLSASGTGTLADRGDAALIAKTLAAMDAEYREGSALLMEAWLKDRDRALLATLNAFSSTQLARLTSLAPSLPASVRAQAETSMTLLSTVGTRAESLLSGRCSDTCAGRVGSAVPGSPAGVPCGCTPAPPAGPGATTPTTAPAPPAPTPGAGTSGQPQSPDRSPAPAPPSDEPGLGGLLGSLAPSPAPDASVGVPTRTPGAGVSPLPVPLPTGLPTLPLLPGS